MQLHTARLTAVVALLMVATACSGAADPPVTTSVVPTTETEAPTTTSGATTTISPSTTTSASPTTTVRPDDGSIVGPVSVDPGACEIGPPPQPDQVEITFSSDGFLVAGTDDGSVRCLVPFENQERIVWGPHGDQVLVGTTRLADTAYAGTIGAGAHFTRPTGRNLVWVEDGRLWKAAVDGSGLRDISFLPQHVAVTYHPAGVEIAAVGVDDEGRYGVWVARNDGTEAQRVVTAEEAVIGEAAFSESSGFFLSFVAEHEDGRRHLHELALVDGDGLAVRNEFDASIALETDRPLRGIVANPWTDEVAVTEGLCGEEGGSRARLPWGGELPEIGDGVSTEAIGWLPGSRLLVAAYPDGCDGARTLWIVETAFGSSSEPALLVRDAGAAAIRAVYPEPPKPLGEIDLDDFA